MLDILQKFLKPSKLNIVFEEEKDRMEQERIQRMEELEEQIREAKVAGPAKKDKQLDQPSISITGKEDILDVKKAGHLYELLIKTNTSNFKIRLDAGLHFKIRDTYSEILKYADYINSISAFYDSNEGYYIFHITDVDFTHLLIQVESTSGSMELNRVFVKWEEHD